MRKQLSLHQDFHFLAKLSVVLIHGHLMDPTFVVLVFPLEIFPFVPGGYLFEVEVVGNCFLFPINNALTNFQSFYY